MRALCWNGPKKVERIQRDGEDLSYVVAHELSLDEAPQAHETFNNKEDHCLKVVLHP